MMSANTRIGAAQRGIGGEVRARKHLEHNGLALLDAGWRCRLGELDLVMIDGQTLVFVEVRARQAGNVVSAIESIDRSKQNRFVRAARAWLAAHAERAHLPARFDIVAIDGDALVWHADAFSVSSH